MSETKTEQAEYEIDLLQLGKALWHRIVLILLAGVLTASIGYLYTRFYVTPLYQSTATFYVNNKSISVGSGSLSLSTGDLNVSKSLVSSYIVILRSRTTLNEVIEKTGVPYSYAQLRKMISAASVDDTEIFQIKVTGPDAEETERIANCIALVLPETVASIIDGTSVRTVDYAVAPTNPSSPSYTRNVAIAFLIGVALAAAVVVIRFLTDDTIRTEDYLTENYKSIPLLAVVPDLLGGRTKGYGSHYGYGYGYGYGSQTDGDKSRKG
ncbi:MAG: hypothetical protein IKS66_02415 [Oscillospiraceae bacterium]|nr:hypothetical protein [Oscillospiraceae bacterium]